jgi:hypothetical protein
MPARDLEKIMTPTYRFKLIFIVLFSGAVVFSHANAQTYDLPLFANDLKPGERYFTRNHANTTTQKYAYDITARRLNKGSWTSLKSGVTSTRHWRNPKNSNYFVYGKPFYAMRDGIVIACFRNAPQNPRPKRPEEDGDVPTSEKAWVHKNLKDGLMPGGGNELYILHDDGTRALYAHAQTGSIPASLCPKTKSKFSAPRDSNNDPVDENGMYPEIALLPAQRKRVKAGRLLGRIGNSGSSSGPHIHIHVEKKNRAGKWRADPTKFRRGMSTPWNGGKADIAKWTSFSGKIITKGDVLFWPPSRLTKEFARHKASIGSFSRVFKHLANSGYQPKILDLYSVGGKVYLNHIWVPRTGAWRAWWGQTKTAMQANLNKSKADGYAPVFAESYLSGGQVRYATIYLKNKSGKWRLRSNMGAKQHQDVLNEAKKDGLKPITVSVVSKGKKRYYTALYRSDKIGSWALKSSVLESNYQAEVNTQLKAGRLPIYLCGYVHNGAAQYSVIFSSKFGKKVRARHKMSSSTYQTEYTKARKDGLLTQTVSAFDGAKSQHRFGAAWIRP